MTGSVPAPAIVIVGAGDCGTRAAFTLREEGWDGRIVLVGAEPGLPYERPPLSKTWQLKPSADEGTLRDAGITLLRGLEATGLDTAAHVLKLADGGMTEVDVVIAGVGAVPEMSLAKTAGIETGDGIMVDARFATSAPGVFAAGDCCCYPHPLYAGKPLRVESWRAALEHGAAAARAMLGTTEPYAGVPWFRSDQHDLSLQVAGLTSAAVTGVVRVRPDGVEIWFGLDADRRLVAAAAAGPGNAVARDIRIAQMLIAHRAAPDPAVLADPAAALRPLLHAPADA
jgi:3-phenylpropionate/trans-cinnamate dioxygenase ferredoxin reductase subunit